MYIKEILATKFLPGSTTPRLDLELLLAEVLQKPRSFLLAHSELELSCEQAKAFQILYKRRLGGEPMAYILGRKEFWSLVLTINDKVLIPRPETELLVELILQLDNPNAKVADLGTGSGAIALALAKERPSWQITATDISEDALQVARFNAKKYQMPNIVFYCGDWCQVLPDEKFDVIVSNPPYLAQEDPHLKLGDVKFEPKTALVAGDGLAAIKKIISQAKNKLRVNGVLALEHGYDQQSAIQKLLQQNGYQEITAYKDLAGIARVVVARCQK